MAKGYKGPTLTGNKEADAVRLLFHNDDVTSVDSGPKSIEDSIVLKRPGSAPSEAAAAVTKRLDVTPLKRRPQSATVGKPRAAHYARDEALPEYNIHETHLEPQLRRIRGLLEADARSAGTYVHQTKFAPAADAGPSPQTSLQAGPTAKDPTSAASTSRAPRRPPRRRRKGPSWGRGRPLPVPCGRRPHLLCGRGRHLPPPRVHLPLLCGLRPRPRVHGRLRRQRPLGAGVSLRPRPPRRGTLLPVRGPRRRRRHPSRRRELGRDETGRHGAEAVPFVTIVRGILFL